MVFRRLWLLLALVLIGTACSTAPEAQQRFGFATGYFTRVSASDCTCILFEIGSPAVTLDCNPASAPHGPNFNFPVPPKKHTRYQAIGELQYVGGLANAVVLESERGDPIRDPRVKDGPFYFPFLIHHLRLGALHLCDALDEKDCTDVAESELKDTVLWCEDSSINGLGK